MTPPEIANLCNQLAAKIRAIDSGAAARLRNVASSLSSPDFATLAHLDLRAIIDPDAIEERAIVHYERRPSWLPWLEWVRNWSVLAPIVLTWIGLSMAAANYQKVAPLKEEYLRQPFLLLWEQGFPQLGTPQWLTFSHLALVDFVILLFVLGMSVVIHFWRDIREEGAEKQAAELRAEVEQTLWEIGRFFSATVLSSDAGKQAFQLNQVIQEFKQRADELLDVIAQEQVQQHKLNQERQEDLRKLQAFANGLTDGASKLIQHEQQVRQVYGQVQAQVRLLADGVVGLNKQEEQVVRSLEAVGKDSRTATVGLRTVSKELGGAAGQLSLTAQQNTTNVQAITAAADEMRALAKAVVAGDDTLRKAFLQSSQDAAKVRQDLAGALKELRSTSGRTADAVTKLQGISTTMDELVKLNREVANGLSRSSGEQKRMVDAMTQAFERQWSTFLSNLGQQPWIVQSTATSPRLAWLGVALALIVALGALSMWLFGIQVVIGK